MPRALILSLSSHSEGDGANRLPPLRVWQQQQALADAGWDVHHIEFMRFKAPPIGQFVKRALLFRKTIRAMVASALKADRPDLIITHDIETLPAAVRVAKVFNVPLIYDSHENWPALISNNSRLEACIAALMERRMLRHIDCVMTVSPSIAARFRGLGKRTTVLYNARRASEMATMPKSEARKELGLDPDDIILGFIGNLHELEKGNMIEDLFDVLFKLPPNVKVLIVGGPDDLAEVFKWKAEDSGVEDRVICTGRLPFKKLAPYYGALDVGLVLLRPIPGYIESIGWKFFDYIGRGIPVLVPDFPDLSWMVEKLGCGWTYHDGSRYLFGRLEDIVLLPATERARLGVNGLTAFASLYAWEKQAWKFVTLCEWLTRKR